VVLLGAGAVAGTIGSAGGITSLVSYPALLLVGIPPLPANVANLVAAVACWPGAALTSRREVTKNKAFLWRAMPVAAAGGAAGAVLLLLTPPGAFARIVPFLVLAGSVGLIAEPLLTPRAEQWRQRRFVRAPLILTAVGVVSVYSGYFGAGSGVLLLLVTLILVDQRLPRANAAKNMLLGASTVLAAAIYILGGPVDWFAVVPLAVGLFAGSLGGPIIARHAPAHLLRLAVAALGFVLALELWLHTT